MNEPNWQARAEAADGALGVSILLRERRRKQ